MGGRKRMWQERRHETQSVIQEQQEELWRKSKWIFFSCWKWGALVVYVAKKIGIVKRPL